ncbi:MurR/RpiR family transcriptional regulator [Candidatus Phycosocius spiralis]|uniref:HTH-type transcriptional regulator n=1 Tax=Candidatus Phycosocius spiralis TaxID=2815099 RepID=A0ABQ4PYF7_9PROT|nr:MurR/RpiR family transcriptional regulator [Candidatus Phycosocius spiralis]GIU68014.1 putative HTH-type transcriptional regulator [Candidatus Phycosocius spiralis]
MTETTETVMKGRGRNQDQALVENIIARIRLSYKTMGPMSKTIANFILAQPQRVMAMSVTELSETTGASQGSVVNFCQNLGLSGFQQLKLSLAQAVVQPVQYIHEDLERSDDIETVCRKVFHGGIQALRDSKSALEPKSIAAAVQLMRSAKRIEIYGIGSSAPIAEDAHYRMLRIGLDAKAVTDSHVQAISASRTTPDVAVLTISHTGSTRETVVATQLAKEAGAKTVVLTNFGRSPIQAFADVTLFTMACETLFRTEAMTSRIAQLCVIDTLIAALALADYERSIQTLRETFDVLSLKRF